MTRKKRPQGDVLWYAPDPKIRRPLASSTKASSDLIALLNAQYPTPKEILAHITYDAEAKAVMQAYIDRGFGDVPCRFG
jgi:hypothetical protein